MLVSGSRPTLWIGHLSAPPAAEVCSVPVCHLAHEGTREIIKAAAEALVRNRPHDNERPLADKAFPLNRAGIKSLARKLWARRLYKTNLNAVPSRIM